MRRGIPSSLITNFGSFAYWDLFSINFSSSFAGLSVTSIVKTKHKKQYRKGPSYSIASTLLRQTARKKHHSKLLNSQLEACQVPNGIYIETRKAPTITQNELRASCFHLESLVHWYKSTTLSFHSTPIGLSYLIYKKGWTKVISEIISNTNICSIMIITK